MMSRDFKRILRRRGGGRGERRACTPNNPCRSGFKLTVYRRAGNKEEDESSHHLKIQTTLRDLKIQNGG
jgi:hypothetical protein